MAAIESNSTDPRTRIRVSHSGRFKSYEGTKADIIAAGLATETQCPIQRGKEITYELGGSQAICSLEDLAQQLYWVRVFDPQPDVCREITSALGDGCALGDFLSRHTSLFYGVTEYVGYFSSLPTCSDTSTEILSRLAQQLGKALGEAQLLFKDRPRYQREIKAALKVLGQVQPVALAVCDYQDNSLPPKAAEDLLTEYMRRLGDHVANAAEDVGNTEGKNWRRSPRHEEDLVEELAAD